MNYLLDTHAFLWLDSDPTKLSPKIAAICQDQTNILLLSIASVWEMQIKIQLGKLILSTALGQAVENQLRMNQIQLLPIDLAHILGLDSLPNYHKDPFDRLLVSQAAIENLLLITNDPKIAQYPIQTVW